MSDFDAADPFPLLPEGLGSDAEARHAEAVDHWLGLNTAETEARLLSRAGASPLPGAETGAQHWIGRAVRVFQTPYLELRRMLAALAPQPGQKIVDLGAAYGRLGFVLARHYPTVEFLGYEVVAERVRAGSDAMARLNPEARFRLVETDIAETEFVPERADYYFIYDYGTRPQIEKTLEDLRELARSAPLTVIARGNASRDAIARAHPWLEGRHLGPYSIYRS
jgi:precorrin-6B methylase 2